MAISGAENRFPAISGVNPDPMCWDLVPNSLFIPPIRETYPDRSLLFWS